MIIGARLKNIREQKGLTQGEIEERTGLRRCYISRVENGHTVPAVSTLEKWTRALGMPLYRLFYGSQDGSESPDLPGQGKEGKAAWAKAREDARLFAKFRRLMGRVEETDRQLLLTMAQTMAETDHHSKGSSRPKKGKKRSRT